MDAISKVRNHYLLVRFPFAKQFIKFSFVGVVVTTIDFTTYILLTRLFEWWGEHYLYANGVAFITAVTFSFFANKFWTFRNDHPSYKKQYAQFFIISTISLTGSQMVLYLLVTVANFNDIIAKLFAIAVVVMWNFTAYKFIVFKKENLTE